MGGMEGRGVILWLNKATAELAERNKEEEEGRSLSTEVTAGTH